MIQEVKRGKYLLIVNISENGKRVKRRVKTVYCSGKKEAKKLYQEFEAEVRLNLSDDSVRQLVDDYISSCSQTCKATTIDGYNKARNRLFSFLSNEKASEVRSIDIDRIVAEMGKIYSSKTISNTIGLLSSAYERGISLNQLQNNPCANVKKPKLNSREPNTLDVNEINDLLSELNQCDLDTRVAVKLALFCGLRRSEICGLIPEDFTGDAIRIRRTRHISKTGEVVQDTKTGNSNRVVALPSFLSEDISQLIELHNGYDFEHEEWLILNGDKGINPQTLSSRVTRLEKQSGVKNCSIHGLRHTYATVLLNSNEVDIAQISRNLGHSNIYTTLNVYSHAIGGADASSRHISNTIDAIFSQNTTRNTTSEK